MYVIFKTILFCLFCSIAQAENLSSKIVEIERNLQAIKNKLKINNNSPKPYLENSAELQTRLISLEEEIRSLNGKIENVELKFDNFVKAQSQQQQNIKDSPINNAINTQLEINTKKPDPSEIEQAETNRQKYDHYNQALMLIKKAELDKAHLVLNNFIKKYPKDPLVGQAYYWQGEIFYAKQVYDQAVLQYLKSFKEFPKSSKAPNSLLKLSVSLAKLKKYSEACKYIRKLYVIFPNMPQNLKIKADREYNRINCDNHR